MKKVTVGFKCSPEQKQNLQAKADAHGMTLSAYLEYMSYPANPRPTETTTMRQENNRTLDNHLVIGLNNEDGTMLRMEGASRGMTLEHYIETILRNRHGDKGHTLRLAPDQMIIPERMADALEQLLVILEGQTKLIERSVANSEAMLNHVVGHTEQRPTAPPPSEQKEVVQFPVVPDPWKGMSAGNRAFMERLRSDHGTQWFDSHLDGLGTVQRECNAGEWLPLFRKFERMGLMEIRTIGTQGRKLRIRARFMFITKQP